MSLGLLLRPGQVTCDHDDTMCWTWEYQSINIIIRLSCRLQYNAALCPDCVSQSSDHNSLNRKFNIKCNLSKLHSIYPSPSECITDYIQLWVFKQFRFVQLPIWVVARFQWAVWPSSWTVQYFQHCFWYNFDTPSVALTKIEFANDPNPHCLFKFQIFKYFVFCIIIGLCNSSFGQSFWSWSQINLMKLNNYSPFPKHIKSLWFEKCK